MYSKRQLEIIKVVLNNPQGIFGSALARIFALSSRTIRNEISEINKQVFIISANQKRGYYITDEQTGQVRNLLFQQLAESDGQSEEERLFRLLGILAFRMECDLVQLSEEVFYSCQTVKRDLAKLQKLIDNLQPGINIVTVKEKVQILYEEHTLRQLYLKILKGQIFNESSHKIMPVLLHQHFEQLEYDYLRKTLGDYFNQQRIVLTDDEFVLIIDAVYICTVRNLRGFLMSDKEPITFSAEVDKLLDFILSMEFTIKRNDYHILGNYFSTLKITREETDEIDNLTIAIYEEFCDEVLDKYGIELRMSRELMNRVLVHLEYVMRRVQTDYETLNPIKNEIRQKYPFAYEIAMLFVHIIYRYLNRYIQDDEISYFAIYIAYYLENTHTQLKAVLVTPGRKSLESILENWLKSNFSQNIKIIKKLPQHSMEEYLSSHRVDLIISSATSAIHPEIPVFRLGGLPSLQDRDALNSLIKKIRESRRYREIIKKHFSEKTTKIYRENVSFSEVVADLSKQLEEAGKIGDKDEFAKDVIHRELYYPTYLNEYFMIPHPLLSFAKESAIAAAILKKPLIMDGNAIQIIFMIAIEQKQDGDIGILFHFFNSLSEDMEAMKKIIGINHEHELVAVMLKLSTLMD